MHTSSIVDTKTRGWIGGMLQYPLEGGAVIPIFYDRELGRQAARRTNAREGTVRTRARAERVKLFIDYLYLHFMVENIPERINGCSGHAPGPRSESKGGSGPWRAADGKEGVVHYTGGEMWCTTRGGEEFPYSLTIYCRIVQYRRVQLQCILHFP